MNIIQYYSLSFIRFLTSQGFLRVVGEGDRRQLRAGQHRAAQEPAEGEEEPDPLPLPGRKPPLLAASAEARPGSGRDFCGAPVLQLAGSSTGGPDAERQLRFAALRSAP